MYHLMYHLDSPLSRGNRDLGSNAGPIPPFDCGANLFPVREGHQATAAFPLSALLADESTVEDMVTIAAPIGVEPSANGDQRHTAATRQQDSGEFCSRPLPHSQGLPELTEARKTACPAL